MMRVPTSPADHCASAISDFSIAAETKYDKGQKEHGGNLWERENLLGSSKEEVIDQWFYIDAIGAKVTRIIMELTRLSKEVSSFECGPEDVCSRIHRIVDQLEKL